MLLKRGPLAAVFVMSAAVPCIAQEDPESCVPPQPSGCVEWMHLETYYSVYDIEVSEVEETEFKSGWFTEPACNCFFGPCDDPRIRVCTPDSYTYGRQEETCWAVSGSATVEVKKSLLTRLFHELGVQVSGGFELSGCTTISESWTITPPTSHCFDNHARGVWKIRQVEGTIYEKNVSYWECTQPNGMIVTVGTECQQGAASGFADSATDVEKQYAPLTPECGGPDPPDPKYDGKFAEPCCEPLCPPPDPPTPPCCGLECPE